MAGEEKQIDLHLEDSISHHFLSIYFSDSKLFMLSPFTFVLVSLKLFLSTFLCHAFFLNFGKKRMYAYAQITFLIGILWMVILNQDSVPEPHEKLCQIWLLEGWKWKWWGKDPWKFSPSQNQGENFCQKFPKQTFPKLWKLTKRMQKSRGTLIQEN